MTAILDRRPTALRPNSHAHEAPALSDDLPHALLVDDVFDPDFPDDAFRVEHHPTCPAQLDHEAVGGPKVVYYCHVGVHEAAGPSIYFQHAADATINDGRDLVSAGRHQIEAWSGLKGSTWDDLDYDGGLRVVRQPVSRHLVSP